jgi:hypothetical protein
MFVRLRGSRSQGPPAETGIEAHCASGAKAPKYEGDIVMTVQERPTVVERRPSGGEVARRTLALLFGIVQAVILLRIVFLLLDAREANALVSGILNFSQIFVAPFDGILRTNALSSGGSVLDVAAIVAFIGWTLLEMLAIAAVNIFRREPA